jgi:hypothetical protein
MTPRKGDLPHGDLGKTHIAGKARHKRHTLPEGNTQRQVYNRVTCIIEAAEFSDNTVG